MKKLLCASLLSLSLIPGALAQGMMDWGSGYGMMGGAGVIGLLVYLALVSFVFSAIFWLTYNWLVPRKK
ncbi:MAG: hypothetical protein AABY13_05405 [Nanoarchaeota archaeon]